MFETDAGPHQVKAGFEDALPKISARLRSRHGELASWVGAQGVRLAMAR